MRSPRERTDPGFFVCFFVPSSLRVTSASRCGHDCGKRRPRLTALITVKPMTNRRTAWLTAILTFVLAIGASAQRGRGGAPGSQGTPTPPGPPRVEELKKEVAADVETMKVTTQ